MSLTCQVRIVLNNISTEKARAIKQALEPDNVDFPEGLRLTIEIKENLVFKFESKDEIRKMTGTIDEILEHVQVALKVIEC